MKDYSKILQHPYSQIVCKNKPELMYVLQWAKQNRRDVSSFYWNITKFPIHINLYGELVGHMSDSNRIGEKFSFMEFVNYVNNRGI